jgi:hypothetical protein
VYLQALYIWLSLFKISVLLHMSVHSGCRGGFCRLHSGI